MSKYKVKRPRHMGEIKRIDEQTRIVDLPAAAAAHEAPKLLLVRPSSPRRLLLEGAERCKVSLSVNELFDGGRTESADQLVLQVGDAHEKTMSFHRGGSGVGAGPAPPAPPREAPPLGGIAEARQSDV